MVDDLREELVRAALRRRLDGITPRPLAFEHLMAAVRAEAGRARIRPFGLPRVRAASLRPLAVATLLSFAVGGVGAAAVHGRLGGHGGDGQSPAAPSAGA